MDAWFCHEIYLSYLSYLSRASWMGVHIQSWSIPNLVYNSLTPFADTAFLVFSLDDVCDPAACTNGDCYLGKCKCHANYAQDDVTSLCVLQGNYHLCLNNMIHK